MDSFLKQSKARRDALDRPSRAGFELHLDVDRAARATLGTSPKTGGPICRIMDAEGAGLLTLLPRKGSSFVADVVGELGEEVTLSS